MAHARRSRPPVRTLALVGVIALLTAAVPAVAQESPEEAIPPPAPVRAASADAFGLEVDLGLLGQEVTHLGPTPFVGVTASDSSLPNARDSVTDVGPVGDGPSAGTANVVEVTAEADIQLPLARGTATTSDVDLLQPAVGDAHVVTADVVQAVATTTCVTTTPEEAAAGTAITGLTIAGQAIPVDVPLNTEIEVPGIARVTIKEVLPDTDGIGWTVRGLHVRTLDPLTGAVDSEIIVSEAHSSVDCGGITPPPEPPEPVALDVDKAVVDATVEDDGTVVIEPGDAITWAITVTNVTDATCNVNRVVDYVPQPLTLTSAGDVLEGIEPGQRGENGLVFDIEPVALEPGESLLGTIVVAVPDTIAPGSYFNDALAHGVCGTGRSGLTAGLTRIRPPDVDPCDSPITTGSFVSRLGGEDRTDTALRVSGMLSVDDADTVVIARSDVFADALAASGLAAELCAPLLLNAPDTLNPANLAEAERLEVDTVYLVGGEAALSADIAEELAAEGFEVVRVFGDSRYATAREIAFEIVRIGGPVTQATIVRADIFPDAMSAANLATHARSPILLTDSGQLSGISADALGTLLDADDLVYIGGGEVAIAPAVEDELAQAHPTRRLAGRNRFETSVAFVEEAVRLGALRDITWVASGHDFPDALTGTVGAYRQDAGLLLTNPEDLSDSPATQGYLRQYATDISTAVIVGGTAAVSERVKDQVLEAIRD